MGPVEGRPQFIIFFSLSLPNPLHITIIARTHTSAVWSGVSWVHNRAMGVNKYWKHVEMMTSWQIVRGPQGSGLEVPPLIVSKQRALSNRSDECEAGWSREKGGSYLLVITAWPSECGANRLGTSGWCGRLRTFSSLVYTCSGVCQPLRSTQFYQPNRGIPIITINESSKELQNWKVVITNSVHARAAQ